MRFCLKYHHKSNLLGSWEKIILILSGKDYFENDAYCFLRSQKIAGTMQTLMGGEEIYHYHSKVLLPLLGIMGPFHFVYLTAH